MQPPENPGDDPQAAAGQGGGADPSQPGPPGAGSTPTLSPRFSPQYHFWCEEASATVARVDARSSQRRSTDAVALLYQQFQTFGWPAVPEQEERIRTHGDPVTAMTSGEDRH